MQQIGPGGPMNRTIDATATEKRRIRSVDDGIERKRGDIGLKRAECCHVRSGLASQRSATDDANTSSEHKLSRLAVASY